MTDASGAAAIQHKGDTESFVRSIDEVSDEADTRGQKHLEPQPTLAAPARTPERVGNVAVRRDRKGRYYVQKSVNVPLDLAIWIQDQLGNYRLEDGSKTVQAQDVMLDLMHVGWEMKNK